MSEDNWVYEISADGKMERRLFDASIDEPYEETLADYLAEYQEDEWKSVYGGNDNLFMLIDTLIEQGKI